ncbi:SubName: Full=Uncharacterized protein {ECO:0000313/EMBL:CCA68183.1} [Serendipita indica DSM 11827]|nr:SubName: Full=Uncharacterized protein {ECO:0000313/EMBL:CCA68183.1} [Serendipita indica DSM 11827]
MSCSRPVPEKRTKYVPRAMLVGKPLVPKTALPNSPSETLARSVNKSSYAIGAVARTICPQKFVLDQTSRENVLFTSRAQQGIDAHQELLKKPVRQEHEYQHLKPSTDEEEAAFLFAYLPQRVNNLVKDNKVGEFPVFGYLFDRPFSGAVDEIRLDRGTPNPTVIVNELKTTVKANIGDWSRAGAEMQATLYLYFLRQMMDKSQPFDFDTYFLARGLKPKRPFSSEYAIDLLEKMIPAMRRPTSSIDPRPIDLRDLGRRWNHYIQTLPKFTFPDYTLLTVVRLHEISKVPGFGKFGHAETTKTPYSIEKVMNGIKPLIDILDGHKGMHGPPTELRGLCNTCGHKKSCLVRPKSPPGHARAIKVLRPNPVAPNKPDKATTAAANVYKYWAETFTAPRQPKSSKVAKADAKPKRAHVEDPSWDRKLQQIHSANQRRILRQQLKSREEAVRNSKDSDMFTGVVPYSAPKSTDLVKVAPLSPSNKRSRLRRRRGVTPLSLARLVPRQPVIPKYVEDTWKYEFPTNSNLMAQLEPSNILVTPADAGQPTDADREAEEREARRAKRRRERAENQADVP